MPIKYTFNICMERILPRDERHSFKNGREQFTEPNLFLTPSHSQPNRSLNPVGRFRVVKASMMLETLWNMHRMNDDELKIPKVTLGSEIGRLDQKLWPLEDFQDYACQKRVSNPPYRTVRF